MNPFKLLVVLSLVVLSVDLSESIFWVKYFALVTFGASCFVLGLDYLSRR